MHSESHLLRRHLQNHRKGKGFLELMASMTDSCQPSLTAASAWRGWVHVSGLVSIQRVWCLLEYRCVCRATAHVREVSQMSDVLLVCSPVHLLKLCAYVHIWHVRQQRQIQIIQRFCQSIQPAPEIFRAVEVHFGTKVLQSYKCLQLSWTYNLVGKAWVHFSAQLHAISHSSQSLERYITEIF